MDAGLEASYRLQLRLAEMSIKNYRQLFEDGKAWRDRAIRFWRGMAWAFLFYSAVLTVGLFYLLRATP